MSFLYGQHGTAIRTTTSPPYHSAPGTQDKRAEVWVTQRVTAARTLIIVGKVMMNGQGESAVRFSQECEATMKKYNASGPEGLCREFKLHNLWKKYCNVRSCTSFSGKANGLSPSGRTRRAPGDRSWPSTLLGLRREAEPQQPGSLL